MNSEPVRLNVTEGSIPRACYSCRPTPAHYRETGMKLVQNMQFIRLNMDLKCFRE